MSRYHQRQGFPHVPTPEWFLLRMILQRGFIYCFIVLFASLAVHKFRRYGQLSHFSNSFTGHFGLAESNSILDLALSARGLNLCYVL
jgi:hypothetical protein